MDVSPEATKKLPFGEEEYRRRMLAVRAHMHELGIDVLLVVIPENICYLTGYETIGFSSFQALAIRPEGEPVLFVREMELTVAETTTWLSQFTSYDDAEDPIDSLIALLRYRGWLGSQIAVEQDGGLVSAATISRLSSALESCADGSGLVEEVRRIKSRDEIAWIREACQITEAGMNAALTATLSGATENEVAAAAHSAMLVAGSDFMVIDPIVTSGWRSGIAHTTFQNRVLEPGDTVLLEMSGCKKRYFGPLMRGAAIAPVPSEVERMARTLITALELTVDAIRPGVASGDVDAACRAALKEGGYEQYFRKRTGYSVGVAYSPDWGEGHIVSLRRDDPTILEPGMVFHIPVALRVPRQLGLGFSETVLVTDTGCESLTRFPRTLHVAERTGA